MRKKEREKRREKRGIKKGKRVIRDKKWLYKVSLRGV